MDNRSDYLWGRHSRSGLIYIADLDKGNMSVTNDIENVLVDIKYGSKVNLRGQGIIYRDSMGEWARVLHTEGKFKSFAAIEPHSMTAKYKDEIEDALMRLEM